MSVTSTDSGSDSEELMSKRITIGEGLSADTLATLFQFVRPQKENISDTDADNLEDLLSMQDYIEKSFDTRQPDPLRVPVDMEASPQADAATVIRSDGVVRMNDILSADLCSRCLLAVDADLQREVNAGTDHFTDTNLTGFGNVDSKESRWDMFLHYSGVYKESFESMFEDKSSGLPKLFEDLFVGEDADVYEFAALISDKGAFTQRIHSDSTYQEQCPLYTVFIALQDISVELGPTTFIRGTHTEVDAHRRLRSNRKAFLSSSTYCHALLRAGDAVVMDSRLMHCGSANSLGRRRLLYMTFLNPNFKNMIGDGSKFRDFDISMHQVQQRDRRAEAGKVCAI